MNEILPISGAQSGSHLIDDFKRQVYVERPSKLENAIERVPFDKFHCIKIVRAAFTQMENRCDIRVTEAGRRSGLANKTLAHRFILQKSVIDDFQRDRTLQIGIYSLVRNSHCPPAQLHRSAVLLPYKIIG